ncbi:MAG: DUF2268 domain-containing putative Zn-dependent protease [Gammaproteobacteria bacterium]
MSIKLHLLNAGGKLSPWSGRLEPAFAKSVGSIVALLAVDNVDIVVRAGHRVMPETGIGGYSPSADVVYITLDPEHPRLSTSFEREFLVTLGHELHHCARHSGPGYGRTLGEALITEGLACNFEAELPGGAAPFYARAVEGASLESIAERAKPELQHSPYAHRAWFFGSEIENLPRHAGYSLGFSIVAGYISRHATPASRLWDVPAEKILAEAFPIEI